MSSLILLRTVLVIGVQLQQKKKADWKIAAPSSHFCIMVDWSAGKTPSLPNAVLSFTAGFATGITPWTFSPDPAVKDFAFFPCNKGDKICRPCFAGGLVPVS